MQPRESGGFDKRTLIAFALMILVWVVFTQFLMPKPQPQRSDSAGGPAVETGAPTSGRVTAGGEAAAGAPASGVESLSSGISPSSRFENILPAEPREIVVEGSLYRAAFDCRGARLRSWQLKRYTDAAGQPVELVWQGRRGALSLRIEGPEGILDLSETVFSASETTDVDPRVTVLRFVAEGVPVSVASPAPESAGAMPQTASAVVRVERVFRIDPTRYDITMEQTIQGIPNLRLDHRAVLGWEDGIPDQEVRRSDEHRYKAAVILLATDLIKDGFGGGGFGCSCGGGKASRGGERQYEGMLSWAGVRSKYFAGMVIPETETEAIVTANSEPTAGLVGVRLALPLADEGATVERFVVYAGPIDHRVLKDLDARVHRRVTRIVDFGGKFIAPISKATHWFLLTVRGVIPNYGIVIIILAIFVRILFHPLTVKAMQSQRKLQLLKPELDAVNAKYKDDPEQRTKRIMELHRTHGVNPLGGCLPLLVQMPVIYALYNVLMNAIELRKAPFVLWMQDLSAPDSVGRLFGVPINILPLLMAGTMFWQQKLTPTDPRQAPMLVLMPLMMVFFFYSLPSGLVLYWTMTNLLAIAQQLTMKTPPAPAGSAVSDREAHSAVFGPKRGTQKGE